LEYLNELNAISQPLNLLRVVPPVLLEGSLQSTCMTLKTHPAFVNQILKFDPKSYHDIDHYVVHALLPWDPVAGELGVHRLTDRAFELVNAFFTLEGFRDKTKSSTLNNLIADSVWYLSGIPVCRIEEKENGAIEASSLG
jgi:hypothetical protein